mmetsp:Transcript_10196/g.17762  ORF Transcript_10196/g.17762 Transcript_10196/m.17762 type:complete len:277 (-) Transcript_10196:209-1039(-)|eukprot:CAMPEP_0119108084 /NCGR_PEP_ID=MMETSP1180-20130426/13459_1 /TAXON_ID=3052 ORGANISM="Chlamydomonas cf sp, Strain CCMP681" /NCGR_SAMPLE_ID=MMETSP1180 /ASSEMBLY_ACC=CAM_ASM_000741 /LENGTH=276 /DNA_ID=CAMNT_0007093665 /DNA_START=35 /DNA_END=865 /DNA_ORIENTATION=-
MGKLHQLAAGEDTALLLAALATGGNIEEIDSSTKRTPLHAAAATGQVGSLSLLLERGADVDAEDKTGCTALHLAAACGNLEAVMALLTKSDEDAENEDGNTPSWLALAAGHIKVFEAIADAGADITLHCEEGQTYLHQACAMDSLEAAEILLARGSPIDALDRNRNTPLMLACKAGAWEVARKLVQAGAGIKLVGQDAWTAMHFAAQNPAGTEGALDFVELLADKGASACARTRDGTSPAGVVALDTKSRSKKQKAVDNDMRDLLQELEGQEQDQQ